MHFPSIKLRMRFATYVTLQITYVTLQIHIIHEKYAWKTLSFTAWNVPCISITNSLYILPINYWPMFESRAKPAFLWGKLQSLQTTFLKGLKPADFFFRGAEDHKNLGSYSPITISIFFLRYLHCKKLLYWKAQVHTIWIATAQNCAR